MTPRQIATALGGDPIAGLTHGLDTVGRAAEPFLILSAGRANVDIYANADDLSGVFGVAGRLKTKEFWVRPETLRADLVEILAWSLNAVHPDPAAPETRAALRSPGLYGEVLRHHLSDRRDALSVLGDRYATLIAAIDAALETSC